MERSNRWGSAARLFGFVGYVLGGLWFVGSVIYGFTQPHEDYLFFDYAFRVVWNGHHPSLLYNLQAQHAFLTKLGHAQMTQTYGRYDQFMYPPQFAVLFAWLAALPTTVGTVLWAAADVCSYVTCVIWVVQMSCPAKSGFSRKWLYVLAMVQLPFLWDFLIGNSNWLIFFLIVLCVRLDTQSSRSWIAGIPLGIAVVCKVTPAFFLAYALWRRKWGLAASTLATIAFATALTFAVMGWLPVWHYLTSIGSFGAMSMKNGVAPYNSSMIGVLGWLGQALGVTLSRAVVDVITLLFDVFVCVVIAVGSRMTRHDTRLDAAWPVMGMLLLSPLVEGPHMLLVWMPLTMVLVVRREQLNRWLHRSRARGIAWGIVAAYVIVTLSPLGWVMRTVLPVSGFLVMVGVLWMMYVVARSDVAHTN